MLFYSKLPILKPLAKDLLLLALGGTLFCLSPLSAQQAKETSAISKPSPIETPAPPEPSHTPLLPTTPPTSTETEIHSTSANHPTNSSLTPHPSSDIDSTPLLNEITPPPSASSKQLKPDVLNLKSPSSNDALPPSVTDLRSKLLSKSGEATTTPNSTDTNSSNNNSSAIAAMSKNPEEKISIQFPHTSILEALALYEKLTGKRIIRDSNLAGPDLSLMISDPVSKKDAVALLESTMLVNGYALIPVDEKTVKIIGPSRPPRMEGLPLYQNVVELPTDGERVVSFYQPLHFLSPNEAINILQGVIQINPYGSLVAVPNTSSIVITDKTPVIQKALALLQIIDREPSQIITEFIPLQRADAEKTVETLNQIFGKEGGSTATQPPKPPNSPFQQPNAPSVTPAGDEETRIFSGKVQFIPDKRTNRILLVTKAENYHYIRELISKLDQAVQYEEPLVRPLNYVPVTDVFPVLVDMLKNKDDDTQNGAKQQQTPQNSFKNNSNNSSNPLDPTGGGMGSSSVNAGGSHGDRLNDSAQLQPPQSAIIGSTSLIGDPTANSIIVYGPPESKIKARQIIDLLDRRPQQVYLAAVIGEMRLTEGMDYGSSYLVHYQGFNALTHSLGVEAAKSLFNGVGSAAGIGNAVANNTALIQDNINNTKGGLTLFGSIGGSVDMYARFLESTGKFRTIARPTVYTSNNRKATILSGRKIPYVSSTLNSIVNGQTSTQQANAQTSNITYQDVLLKLEVIPLINADNEVNLIIAQQNQTVADEATTKAVAAGVAAPVVNTQELTTSVRIPSGSTIVLGGLISDEKNVNQNGIPYISRIPIIGPLLGSVTNKKRERNELVVMIQPTVINSNESMFKESELQGGASDLAQRAKGLKAQLQPTPIPTPNKKKFKLFQMKKPDDF